ncbi:hypothetical protein [Streptomyces sp. NBC_01304]|uniref:hypothetical protein n=1 Tax=Streptomyces sp. NBC_01304 TaxID=2903818 RepID=UPI002E11E26E|nr:hypothetical protein OG430_44690 [Streptomyces sp. NBC_01304]
MVSMNCYGKSLTYKDGVLDVKGPTQAVWPGKQPLNAANGTHVDDGGGVWSWDYQMRPMSPARSAPDWEFINIEGAYAVGDKRYWLGPNYPWNIHNPSTTSELVVVGNCAANGIARGLKLGGWAEPMFWVDENPPPSAGSNWPRLTGADVQYYGAVFFHGCLPFTITIPPGQTRALNRAVGFWVRWKYDWNPGPDSTVDLTFRTTAIGFLGQPPPTGQGSSPARTAAAMARPMISVEPPAPWDMEQGDVEDQDVSDVEAVEGGQ